jgi:hypothetical protein
MKSLSKRHSSLSPKLCRPQPKETTKAQREQRKAFWTRIYADEHGWNGTDFCRPPAPFFTQKIFREIRVIRGEFFAQSATNSVFHPIEGQVGRKERQDLGFEAFRDSIYMSAFVNLERVRNVVLAQDLIESPDRRCNPCILGSGIDR